MKFLSVLSSPTGSPDWTKVGWVERQFLQRDPSTKSTPCGAPLRGNQFQIQVESTDSLALGPTDGPRCHTWHVVDPRTRFRSTTSPRRSSSSFSRTVGDPMP